MRRGDRDDEFRAFYFAEAARLKGIALLTTLVTAAVLGFVLCTNLVVFHYGIFPQALDDLKAQGVNLIGLATWWDVLQVAGDLGKHRRRRDAHHHRA